MNPMNRRMFRDPMAARQASGILASSPQLANVVQQRQPVRMQTGGNVDTKMIQAIQQLAANGQTGTLNEIAADTRNSRAVRSAAANALVGAQKASTSIPLASSDETRMAVNRGNLASLRSQAAPQISGPILDSDMSAGDPVTSRNLSIDVDPSMTGASTADSMQAAMSQKASDTPLFAGIGKSMTPSSDTVDQIKRAFGYPLEVFGFDAPADAPGRPNPIGVAIKETMYGNAETQSPAQKLLADADKGVRTASGALANVFNSAESGIANFFTPRVKDALAQAEAGKRRKAVEPTQDVRTVPTASVGIAPVASNVLDDSMDSAVSPSSNVVSPATAGGGEDLSNLAANITALTTPSDIDTDVEKSSQEVDTQTSKSETEKQTVLTPTKLDIISSGSINGEDDQLAATITEQAGTDLKSGVDNIINGKGSNKKKAKDIDALFGIEDLEARKAMLQSLLGERSKDVRTDASYNLMMTGLMIAAGESPDALQNIARGAAQGLKAYGDAKGEQATTADKEDRAITLAAYQDVRAERAAAQKAAQTAEEAQREREFKADESALNRTQQGRLTQAQIDARLDIANMNDETARWIKSQSITAQQKIAGLDRSSRETIARLGRENTEAIAKLPSKEIQGLLAVFGSNEEVKAFLEAKNLAKTSLKQGSTIDAKIENILGDDSLFEMLRDEIEAAGNPVTTESVVEAARNMANQMAASNANNSAVTKIE